MLVREGEAVGEARVRGGEEGARADGEARREGSLRGGEGGGAERGEAEARVPSAAHNRRELGATDHIGEALSDQLDAGRAVRETHADAGQGAALGEEVRRAVRRADAEGVVRAPHHADLLGIGGGIGPRAAPAERGEGEDEPRLLAAISAGAGAEGGGHLPGGGAAGCHRGEIVRGAADHAVHGAIVRRVQAPIAQDPREVPGDEADGRALLPEPPPREGAGDEALEEGDLDAHR